MPKIGGSAEQLAMFLLLHVPGSVTYCLPELRGWPPVARTQPGFDQPADHDRGLPDRRPVGRPPAGPAARGVRAVPRPGRELQLRAGYPVSSTPTSATRSWAGSSPPSPAWPTRNFAAGAAEDPGHGAHRLRGRGIQSPRQAAGPAGVARGYRRAAGGSSRGGVRSGWRVCRWAASSAACATSPAGWPVSPPRSRPAATTRRVRYGRSARDAAAAGPHRLGRRASFPGDGASSPPATCCRLRLFAQTEHPPWAGSSATAAGTRASAATWPGTRPPGPA